MALIDTRLLDDGTVLEADVCILGAGAAGIAMARALADSPLDVVVVESGGLEPDDATQDLAAGEVGGEPMLSHLVPVALRDLRLRYLGGTTNHWAGFCRPLEAIDFETRPGLTLSGWPFGGEELAPWYARATEVLALPSTEFSLDHWAGYPEVPAPILDTPAVTTSLFQIKFPYHLGPVFRRELEEAHNVRVCLWANATNINIAPESDVVRDVTVRTLSGKELSVVARRFVVALGGIENPRLLLASDDVRSAGIGNSADLVGRHFTEHLQALGAVAWLHASMDDLELYRGLAFPPEEAGHERPPDQAAVKGVFSISGDSLRERGLLGMEAQLLVAEPHPEGPVHRGGLGVEPVAALASAQGANGRGTYAFLQVLAEQELQPASRVTLGDDVDALGMRRVRLEWRHSALDRQSIRENLSLIGRELGRLGLGRLQITVGGTATGPMDADAGPLSMYTISPGEFDTEDFPLGIGFHHMCTTRMDPDPARGVVDADGRVHGTANLYVAGSSVFATGGVATPTLTIIALALRLADHLQRTNR